MKISEAAKLTGLNVSSIRFYERKGLLMPQREDGSKYRDYTDEDVQRIRQILLYRKMGISFMGMGIRKWLVGAGAVGVLLFMIVIFCIRVWEAIQNMNAPSIGAAVIWGMLAAAYGTGFLNYLKSRN